MSKNKPYTDKNTLYELYVENLQSGVELGERFGVTPTTIYYHLRKNGIAVRTMKEHRRLCEQLSFWTDMDGYDITSTQLDGKMNCVKLHRLLAVAEYGFEVVSGKDIHHINDVPWDNRPDNLLPVTKSEHLQIHHGTLDPEIVKRRLQDTPEVVVPDGELPA